MGPIGHRLLADDPMGLLDFSRVNNMVWAFFSPLFLLRFSLLLGLLQSERNSQNFWLNFGEKFVQPFLLKMTVWILAGAIVTKDDYEPHKHTPYHSQLHLVFWSPGERSSVFLFFEWWQNIGPLHCREDWWISEAWGGGFPFFPHLQGSIQSQSFPVFPCKWG